MLGVSVDSIARFAGLEIKLIVIRGWRAVRLPPATFCHRYAVNSPPAKLCHRYAVQATVKNAAAL